MRKVINECLAVLMGGALLAACQDLNVPNTNDPDRLRALSSGSDVQTLVVSGWRDVWTRLHRGSSAYNPFPLIADEMSGTYANDAALELSSEPRVGLNNNPTADATSLARFPWESFYQAISSANDGLFAMDNGLAIVDDAGVDRTSRLRSFGKWMQAIGHGWISMLFDQGFVFHESVELPENLEDVLTEVPLVAYTEVRDSAIKFMLEAIGSMEADPFVTEPNWIPERERTSEDLIRLGHSFVAQWYVYGARTPEDRAALPWAAILDHIEQGITDDFVVDLGVTETLQNSSLLNRMQTDGTFAAWGDYKLIGPADTQGNFAAWLAAPLAQRTRFQIETPDRRITGATPASHGSYFRYRPDNIFVPDRGIYHQSHYQWYRGAGQGISSIGGTIGEWFVITLDEMNLIKAEALYYLDRLDEAADLVNTTRTRPQTTMAVDGIEAEDFPGLPPVTAAGVPASADCVPRLDGINCADLLGALMYERMIEGAVIDSYRAYMDSRGWGRLPDGTFLHMPIPGRELEALRMPSYSFGGVGGPDAAVCVQPFCD